MISVLERALRAWPLRPHCDAAAGWHAWTCRLAGLALPGEPVHPDCRHRKLPRKE